MASKILFLCAMVARVSAQPTIVASTVTVMVVPGNSSGVIPDPGYGYDDAVQPVVVPVVQPNITCGSMAPISVAFNVSDCNNINVGSHCLVRCATKVRCILGSMPRVFKCVESSTPPGWVYTGTKINV